MNDDLLDDDGFVEWARHVKTEMVPKMRESAMVVSLVPKEGSDVKFAVELGYAIMLDKPIIAVVTPGASVPRRLAEVADEIVEGSPSDPSFQQRLQEAVGRVVARLEAEA